MDVYGDKHGDIQLAALESELGPLPATITSTSRGPESASRQHFYRVPDGLEFLDKVADDIETVQRHHRYAVVAPSIHPKTGAPYAWYDYEGEPMASFPTLDDFEWLPEPWIEHLQVERPVYKHEQYTGPQAVLASVDEINQVNAIIRRLDALPRVWSEGAGWHDVVFESAAWLSRMVNSAAYVMTADRAVELLLEHTPTYPNWGQEKIFEQWQSAVQVTEGQYADIPRHSIPNPLPFQQVFAKLPDFNARGEAWLDKLVAEPPEENERTYWQYRHVLLIDALRAGLTDEEAVSLVWSTRSSQYLQVDENGLGKLWREVQRARAIVDRENGVTSTPAPTPAPDGALDAPAPVLALVEPQQAEVTLLTDEERAEVDGYQWYGTEYMDFINETLSTVNAQYHRMNMWLTLSLVFAPHAYLMKEGGIIVPLNLWGITVGPSTTGKSEAMEMQRTVHNAYYRGDDDPNIGGDATPEALIKHLIQRDGKASWFVSDEASAHIEASRPGTSGYLKNLREKLTDIYGGRVPRILRNGDQEHSGIDARAFLVMQYAGVDEKVYQALEPSDWESGFLHRFVWAVGSRLERDRENKRKRFAKPGVIRDDKQFDMQKHWAAMFEESLRVLRVPLGLGSDDPVPMEVSDWVIDRDLDFQEYFEGLVRVHEYAELLAPSVERFTWSVMKCAALVAASAGSMQIQRIHYLVALAQAEEWLTNLLDVVGKTAQSSFRRDVDKLEKTILAKPGAKVRETEVYRRSPDRFIADRLIDQLIVDGRATRQRDSMTNETWIQLKQEALAA